VRPNPPPAGERPGVPAVGGQGATERNGIAAFLAGRYEEAAATLTLVVASPARSARAHFYLACSLAALVLTGDRDQSEIVNAQALLRAAGRLDQFAADQRFVSPRVLLALSVQP
jgi:hypothetical protein